VEISVPHSKDVLNKIVMFEDFIGSLSTCILLKAPISKKEFEEIIKKFPNGLVDKECLNTLFEQNINYSKKDITPISYDLNPKKNLLPDRYIIFTPLYSSKETANNLCNSEPAINGNFIGNCGSSYAEFRFIDRIHNLLPFLQIACEFTF